jgi:hypothetical protein
MEANALKDKHTQNTVQHGNSDGSLVLTIKEMDLNANCIS